MFLLKYFKYECGLCERLCSHILLADWCCKSALCLQCCSQLCDQLELIIQQENLNQDESASVALGECIFCANALPQHTLIIRDPTARELDGFAKRTAAAVKQREQQ